MNILGYSIIETEQLEQYKEMEKLTKTLVSEMNNPVPCHVMKHLSKEKLTKLLMKNNEHC